MSDETKRELQVVDPETGEMQTLPTSLDDIARRDTGGMARTVTTTINTETPAGLQQLQRHLDHDQVATEKANGGWYGQPFDCIAITSRGVLAKRDAEGKMMPVPRPLIRTTLETSDGRILSLASSYVYEDCQGLKQFQPLIDRDHPIKIKLRKGGQSDRIVRVFADEVIQQVHRPSTSKKS